MQKRPLRRVPFISSMIAFIALGCQGPGSQATAADEALTPASLSQEEVLSKHGEAMRADLRSGLASLRMSGRMDAVGVTDAPVVVEIASGRFRREIDTGEGFLIDVLSADGAWRKLPRQERAGNMSEASTRTFARQADLAGVLVSAGAKGHTVKLLGKVEIEGKPAYKLELAFTEGDTVFFYLDAESFLIVRHVSEAKFPNRPKPVEQATDFEDYRDVDGLLFPFRLESSAPAASFEQVTRWELIETNVELDDARFAAP